ncbi:hypothetical protein ACFXAO_27230 [Streptomyces lavendulae]|uniref:hypothetical protein n=1 Tax=Streptomyces lavendulae TaxID=1914 RepID=UPI0036CDF944
MSSDPSAAVFRRESVLLVAGSLLFPAAAVTAGRAARTWRQRHHELRESQTREKQLLTERVLTSNSSTCWGS